METLKEFFAAVRERLSSPLIGSFVIAWSIANWPLFVGLAFLDQKGYEYFNAANAVDFVANYLKTDVRLCWPVMAAFAYSFGYPFVKAAIRAVRDKAEAISEKWNLMIVKNSKVDTEKFLRLRDSYLKKEKELQKLIDEEDAVRARSNETNENLRHQLTVNQELIDRNQSLVTEIASVREQLSNAISAQELYSVFDKIEGMSFEPDEPHTRFLNNYHLSFTRTSELKPVLTLKSYHELMPAAGRWYIDELSLDSARKTSVFHCRVIHPVSDGIIGQSDVKVNKIFNDQFYMLVKDELGKNDQIIILFFQTSELVRFNRV